MPYKRSITVDERRALRRWAHRQTPKPTQKQCIDWFQGEYNHRLSQSTVSESLSTAFAHLDDPSTFLPTALRQRTGHWPDLEKVLWEWQIKIELRGGFTTGEILQQKARQIWERLPQYQGKPYPEFSSRWLEKFKKRHDIVSRIRFGEAGSVLISTEEEMKALQTVAGEYNEEDIYNMDETGLYWKMLPSRGLSVQSIPGLKKDKARISIAFCTNATGTDRLPVWFIGKAKVPRALKNVNVNSMGGRWRSNTKAWMTTTVMGEWLQEFYIHVGTERQILLTMDNFSAHYAAIELFPPPKNIRVCWLPANSTSRYQPLDQGIIQNFKAFYRRQWLQFALEAYETDKTPHENMNIRLAIRWTVRSWNNEVTNTTIYNCFRKSTLISTPISLPTPIIPSGFTQLYEEVLKAGNIQDSMAMANFLNPIEESEEQEPESLNADDVLNEVIQDNLGVDNDDDDDEEQIQYIYSAKEALGALQVVLEYSESTENLPSKYIRGLEGLEAIIKGIQEQSKEQGTLDNWLM
jgi:hypothetical protein